MSTDPLTKFVFAPVPKLPPVAVNVARTGVDAAVILLLENT